MASKKYKLLLGLLALITSTTFAQTGASYNVSDSSVVPSKRMPQQNEFWNNTYNFPAKPRNMIEVGVAGGLTTVSGDVPSVIPTWGFTAHVRKAFGYLFSLRLQYAQGVAKGQHWLPAQGFGGNGGTGGAGSGLIGAGYTPNNAPNPNRTATAFLSNKVFYNYKTNLKDLGLQGIVTLNNIRFHKQKTGFTMYGGAGLGATLYKCMINALGSDNKIYDYSSISSGGTHSTRKSIINAIKALPNHDNTYETPADGQGARRPKIGDYTLKPSGTVLAGIAFKLSRRVNLALEDRHTFVKDDLLDGQRWQENPSDVSGGTTRGTTSLTRDFDSWNMLTLGLNFNLGAKSVEPLWWLNPLDYAYGELANARRGTKPTFKLDDADNDGVIDQFDREPNTPANCPVDAHGVTKDTDGDGVPDCKDKQLITPTECQPVDADGVGHCPDPACCGKGPGPKPTTDCPSDYPSLHIKGAGLTSDNKAMLAAVAAKLKANPTCSISITGYPGASKSMQNACGKRNDAIKAYLVGSLGIASNRVTTDCVVGGGDVNTVDIKAN